MRALRAERYDDMGNAKFACALAQRGGQLLHLDLIQDQKIKERQRRENSCRLKRGGGIGGTKAATLGQRERLDLSIGFVLGDNPIALACARKRSANQLRTDPAICAGIDDDRVLSTVGNRDDRFARISV